MGRGRSDHFALVMGAHRGQRSLICRADPVALEAFSRARRALASGDAAPAEALLAPLRPEGPGPSSAARPLIIDLARHHVGQASRQDGSTRDAHTAKRALSLLLGPRQEPLSFDLAGVEDEAGESLARWAVGGLAAAGMEHQVPALLRSSVCTAVSAGLRERGAGSLTRMLSVSSIGPDDWQRAVERSVGHPVDEKAVNARLLEAASGQVVEYVVFEADCMRLESRLGDDALFSLPEVRACLSEAFAEGIMSEILGEPYRRPASLPFEAIKERESLLRG